VIIYFWGGVVELQSSVVKSAQWQAIVSIISPDGEAISHQVDGLHAEYLAEYLGSIKREHDAV
jgi:hypothetical protein